MKRSVERYPELDLLRVLAIALMVAYHVVFDLWYFYRYPIDPFAWRWWIVARVAGSLFLLLVGVCFAISHHRTDADARFGKFWRRGLMIFFWGLLITVVSAVVAPDFYVRFGILHLIGVSILLLPLFVGFKEWNALFGLFIILIGIPMEWSIVSTSLLLPIGFIPPGFATFDFVPLFPWFGVVLLGLALGSFLYVRDMSWRKWIPVVDAPVIHWLGRRSLFIYLIHHPIVLFLLFLLLGNPF